MKGFARKSSWWDDQPVDLGGCGVWRRKDLYPLTESDAMDEAVTLWRDWHRFGLAHGKGYAEEPEEYIALLSALEDEYEAVQAEMAEEAENKRSRSRA